MRGISWLAKELLASQEGVRSVECYNFYTHCGDLCSLGGNIDEFESGGLHEKHGEAACTSRTISAFAGRLRESNETGVKMAGRRNLWIHIDIWRAVR